MTAYVYRPNHPLADKSGMVPKDIAGPLHEKHGEMNFMPDIAEFIAPGFVPIGSRTKLREYERRTGSRQCGELKSIADFDYRAIDTREPDKRRIGEAYRTALDKLGYL